jgi:hypothetical protein
MNIYGMFSIFFYSYGENIDPKLQQKICTKAFYIVCSMCITTNLKSNYRKSIFIGWG